MHSDFSILVVEDDLALQETLVAVLEGMPWASFGSARIAGSGRKKQISVRVDRAGSLAEVRALEAAPYDLVLLDFVLPDGTGAEVLALLAGRGPLPIVIAISGETGPEEAFLLAQNGVRAFLRKPFGLRALQELVEKSLSDPPDPLPLVRGAVGKKPLKAIEDDVREAMVNEALARTRGSVRAAASLLGISRQMLGHILKKDR